MPALRKTKSLGVFNNNQSHLSGLLGGGSILSLDGIKKDLGWYIRFAQK